MKKIINLIMDDWFVSLISISYSGYNFAIAVIAINNCQYVETGAAALFSILSFGTGYVLWKRNNDMEDEQQHKKTVKSKKNKSNYKRLS
ncbi:hypothetical protein [Ruminiclostridium cellobioparum]|nr:hypothetical protein [Ruminiclostridium cellobioparum]